MCERVSVQVGALRKSLVESCQKRTFFYKDLGLIRSAPDKCNPKYNDFEM